MRLYFNVAAIVVCYKFVAGSDAGCWASRVKTTIKVRDEAQLGPIPENLTGGARIQELLKNGIPRANLTSGVDGGERVDLNVICRCRSRPKLAADGNYLAGKAGLHEAPCEGFVPFSRARYSVVEPETCFAAALRGSQVNRMVVSSFLLSTGVEGEGHKLMSATKERSERGRIFRRGEFHLGAIGYGDVCNQDKVGGAFPVPRAIGVPSAKEILLTHYDTPETLPLGALGMSVHRKAVGAEFYY